MSDVLRLLEQAELTAADWAELAGDEVDPFGEGNSEIVWQPKQRHVVLRGSDGRLVAAAGALVTPVRAGERFEVVGVGSVIVTRALRGRGLVTRLLEALLPLAEAVGPDRAMLFCRPELTSLYGRFGFAAIAARVTADQPGRRIEMPAAAMWRPLRAGATWPAGPVDVVGLPF